MVLVEFNGFWFTFVLSKDENLVVYVEFYQTCFERTLTAAKKSENKINMGFEDAEDIFNHIFTSHFPQLKKNFPHKY